MAAAAPKVSIICAFLNAERFLGEAIDSVLGQDYAAFELILVDDGSTDSGTAIARGYAERFPDQVRYLEHPGHSNRGASPSRNLGLREARGEYIAFIDSDDVWRPGKLSEQLSIMRANPRIGMLCGQVNYWSSWAGGPDKLVPTGNKRDGLSQPLETILELYPLGDAHAPCPSDVMIRRAILDDRPFEEQFIGPAQIYEDQVFFVKAYLAAPVYFSSKVWLDYRQHPDSCVSVVVRDGLYGSVRRDFLNWFADYVAERPIPEAHRIMKSIERAKRDLSHPVAARFRRLGRRLRGAVTN